MDRVAVYFEACAVIISLTLLGQILELKARAQTSAATGVGARSHVSGRSVAPGDTALMDQLGVSVARLRGQTEALRKEGASVTYLAVDDAPAGLLAVLYRIKASTPEALRALREAGPHIVMATGAGLTPARAVAAKLGIGEVYGEVKPADKLALVECLRKLGVNDAPALAKADVGITIGTGTDVVMNSAQGRCAVRATIANMKQNLGFAFVYDALGVPLAAGLLYPFTGWLLSPMIAALAMSLSAASSFTNPLRLRKTT